MKQRRHRDAAYMALHNEIGKIGEDIAAKWLIDHEISVIERNYRKNYGEIDIVARGTTEIRFIEVKSVSYETKSDLQHAVSHETWRPEENVHYLKQKRFGNTVETWIDENGYIGDWQIDIMTVRVVPREKYAVVDLLENVIFE